MDTPGRDAGLGLLAAWLLPGTPTGAVDVPRLHALQRAADAPQPHGDGSALRTLPSGLSLGTPLLGPRRPTDAGGDGGSTARAGGGLSWAWDAVAGIFGGSSTAATESAAEIARRGRYGETLPGRGGERGGARRRWVGVTALAAAVEDDMSLTLSPFHAWRPDRARGAAEPLMQAAWPETDSVDAEAAAPNGSFAALAPRNQGRNSAWSTSSDEEGGAGRTAGPVRQQQLSLDIRGGFVTLVATPRASAASSRDASAAVASAGSSGAPAMLVHGQSFTLSSLASATAAAAVAAASPRFGPRQAATGATRVSHAGAGAAPHPGLGLSGDAKAPASRRPIGAFGAGTGRANIQHVTAVEIPAASAVAAAADAIKEELLREAVWGEDDAYGAVPLASLRFHEREFDCAQFSYTHAMASVAPSLVAGVPHAVRRFQRHHRVPTPRAIEAVAALLYTEAELSPECSVICLVYIERLMRVADVKLLACNWRPVLVAGLLLASKVWQDLSTWNAEFTDIVAEWPLAGVNELERRFVSALGFDLFITQETFARYYFALRSLGERVGFRRRFMRSVLQSSFRPDDSSAGKSRRGHDAAAAGSGSASSCGSSGLHAGHRQPAAAAHSSPPLRPSLREAKTAAEPGRGAGSILGASSLQQPPLRRHASSPGHPRRFARSTSHPALLVDVPSE